MSLSLRTASRKPMTVRVTSRRRICFSLPFAMQLLDSGGGYFGGAEVRGTIFLRGIAKDSRLDVHVVVIGPAGPPIVRADGITVHFRPGVPFDEGHQDDAVTSIWAAIDAEIYVAFGANEATSELARFCSAHGSRLLLSLASEASFDPYVYERSTEPDHYGMPGHYIWYGMQHAHDVIVQTERQQALLRTHLSRESTLIRNPAPASVRSPARTAPSHDGRLLWIGRIDPNKRHDAALALAGLLPQRPMTMVCNNIHSVGAPLLAQVQRVLPNLTLLDHVPLSQIDALFREADVLVNTSIVEGFPNTFLQAGMHGIPVVSMSVDPDGMLAVHGCGRVSDGTCAGMSKTIEALLQDRGAYADCAAASARWVHERHGAAERIAEFSVVLYRALSAHR